VVSFPEILVWGGVEEKDKRGGRKPEKSTGKRDDGGMGW